MDQNTVGDRGGNATHSKAGLRGAQITGHYNEFQIQNNVFFTIDGKFGALASADNVNTSLAAETFSLPTSANIPACNAAVFALWVDSTNNISVTRGPLVDVTKLTGTSRSGEKVINLPDIEASKAVFGLIKVVVGTGATFNFGTTNYNATNVTTTFYDVQKMPASPFTS